jgi:hypothetical protein
MVTVRMMQAVVHQVVDVIAVWYRLVSARRTVAMRGVVLAAVVITSAFVRVLARHLETVLVYVPLMRMVQAAIVEVVRVPVMLDGSVSTVRPVLV